ncbi:MAG: hypothetical protein ACE5JI_23285 [Acidobacteriota bacterium]
MSVTLIFHGGLFTVLPGSHPARRVDVHMRMPKGVKVTAAGEPRPRLEALFSSSSRLDFEGEGELSPPRLPIRQISHVIPINYQGFQKTVSFRGGAVSGEGGTVSDAQSDRLRESKKARAVTEKVAAFKTITGVTSAEHDRLPEGSGPPSSDEYMTRLALDFIERSQESDLACWMKGYRIRVKLSGAEILAVLDGLTDLAERLREDLTVEFAFNEQSTIPHYPLGNPHVLEQPPTI